MTMTVPFEMAYEFEVNALAADVFDVLSDVPASASLFPKLHQLVDLGGNCYRWELDKVGPAQMTIQTVYACHYVVDKKNGSVVWTPIAGEGNAQVGGSWAITDKKNFTHLVLTSRGELLLPPPALMKGIVAPIVLGENERLLKQYIANLTQRFGGEHSQESMVTCIKS
jgi:carbon monoxide dehydrogenase subunit G